MDRLEGWAFLCLMGSMVTVALSMSLLSGRWQIAGALTGVVVGVFAGGLYAASVRPRPTNGADSALANDVEA